MEGRVLLAPSVSFQICLWCHAERVCSVDNGRCDHNCRSAGDGSAICSCWRGYRLATDRTTCDGEDLKLLFIFKLLAMVFTKFVSTHFVVCFVCLAHPHHRNRRVRREAWSVQPALHQHRWLPPLRLSPRLRADGGPQKLPQPG